MKQIKILACAFLLSIGIASRAEIVISADEDTTVRVEQVANISFDGDFNTGNLIVNYIDGTSAAFPISSIQQVTLKTDEANAIKPVSAKPIIAVQGNILFITSEGGKVGIYDTTGRMMTSVELSSGTTPLSLGQLPDGIYVANINGHIVKFQKK